LTLHFNKCFLHTPSTQKKSAIQSIGLDIELDLTPHSYFYQFVHESG